MKNVLTTFFLSFLLFSSFSSYSQVALPYYSGFDTPSEQAGWVEYKKDGILTGGWEVTTLSAFSAPNALYQIYSTSENVDNWLVSPAFSIPSGGSLDSIRYMFNGFEQPYENDTVAIYLLSGSPDPDLAEKTLLADFRDDDYTNDGVYRKLSNVALPGSAGSSYLAIRFKCETFHWLECRFDNVSISDNVVAGTSDETINTYLVYPNPGQGILTIQHNGKGDAEFKIVDLCGRVLLKDKMIGGQTTTLDLSNEPKGVYLLEVHNGSTFERQKIRIF